MLLRVFPEVLLASVSLSRCQRRAWWTHTGGTQTSALRLADRLSQTQNQGSRASRERLPRVCWVSGNRLTRVRQSWLPVV